MSIQYCENCHKHIDTDFEAEHFENDRCIYKECTMDEACDCEDCSIENSVKKD